MALPCPRGREEPSIERSGCNKVSPFSGSFMYSGVTGMR